MQKGFSLAAVINSALTGRAVVSSRQSKASSKLTVYTSFSPL